MDTKPMTTLEEKLAKLEELTLKLEEGSLPIDQAIELYSQGMSLAVSCKQSLDTLSTQVQVARKNAQKSISLESVDVVSDDDVEF